MSTAVSLTFELLTLGIVLLIGVLFAAMPNLTRPSLYFAVTVLPSVRQSSEGRRALARYRATVVSGTVCCAVLALLIRPSLHPIAGAAIPLLLLGIALGAFLMARRAVLPFSQAPTPVRDAELEERHTPLPGGVVLQALPFAALAAVAGLLLLRWNDIPARFPVHWGVDAQPDGWATRTVAGVFGPVLTGVIACVLLLLIAWGITRWSRRLAVAGPRAVREIRFRRLVMWVLLVSELLLAGVSGWQALLPILSPQAPRLGAIVIAVLTVAGVMVLMVVLVRTGQGGSRLVLEGTSGGADDASVGDRTDDRRWKAGLFYINPGDPALFVEKRFGIGYTVNFGNPWAWVLICLVVGVPVILAYLV